MDVSIPLWWPHHHWNIILILLHHTSAIEQAKTHEPSQKRKTTLPNISQFKSMKIRLELHNVHRPTVFAGLKLWKIWSGSSRMHFLYIKSMIAGLFCRLCISLSLLQPNQLSWAELSWHDGLAGWLIERANDEKCWLVLSWADWPVR